MDSEENGWTLNGFGSVEEETDGAVGVLAVEDPRAGADADAQALVADGDGGRTLQMCGCYGQRGAGGAVSFSRGANRVVALGVRPSW